MDFCDIMECNSKLHDAVLEENVELIRSILESSSCNVNETEEKRLNGRTALHLAAMRGKTNIVGLLLDNGADVSASDSHGNTPLHWCGHADTIELLIEHGANVLQCNKRGLTPRDMAERRGVTGLAYDLLYQLEVEAREAGDPSYSATGTAAEEDSLLRFPSSTTSRRKKQSNSGQFLSGLWQECASELGSRNFLLLIVGVLGFSLYIAFILTGMHLGSHGRIPIEVH